MRVHFGGIEVGAHRALLAKLGVFHGAFNVSPVVDSRNGNAGSADELEPFEVVFYSSQTVDEDAMAKVLAAYADESSVVIGTEYANASPARIVPVWNGDDLETFYEMAVEYGAVFLDEADALREEVSRALTMFVRRNQHVRVWTTSSKTSVLAQPFLSDVIVTGWVAAQKHRELQVWDGARVARSPRSSRAKQLDAHRPQIQNLGCDVELLKEGDVAESVRLAIISWLQYEKVVARNNVIQMPGVGEHEGTSLAIQPPEVVERDRAVIPTLMVRSDDDGVQATAPNGRLLRQCDACKFAAVCPEYKPSASCAFSIPVRIRSIDQRRDVVSAALEIQFQRFLEARFDEDISSQGPQANTGKEFDRFLSGLAAAKALEENRETLTIQANGNGGGMLSAIFGNKVGDVQRALPVPVDADDILDAVLDDGLT